VHRIPVVFIHGEWFHLSCWDGWADRFTAHADHGITATESEA
jgi:hypothetical protein